MGCRHTFDALHHLFPPQSAGLTHVQSPPTKVRYQVYVSGGKLTTPHEVKPQFLCKDTMCALGGFCLIASWNGP